MSEVPVIPPSPNNTIACGIVFPIVSGIIVALRFYCRHVQQAKLGIDDWLTVPAWVFTTGMAICLTMGVYGKAYAYPSPTPKPGQDPATFKAPEIILNRQLEFALELMQFPAITCIKLSFLFFYKRIFCTPSTVILNVIIWTAIMLCTIWGVSFFFAFLFVCGTEFTAFWGTPTVFKSHCGIILPENFWISITDFALDIIVFVIPIPLIWRLQLSKTRKLALLAIFAVGAVTLAASITRMIIFVNAVQVLKKAYKSSGTNNLTVTAGLYWTVFECGIGLIAACLPAIYVLLRRASERYFGLKTSPSAQSGGSGWRTYRSHYSSRSHDKKGPASEIELVPRDAAVATTIERSVSLELEGQYKVESEAQSNGVLVSTTVKRAVV